MAHNNDIHLFAPAALGWAARNEILRYCKSADGQNRFIVDLSGTREIDSIGLGLLLQLAERAGGDRDRVFFARAQGVVLDALKAAGAEAIAHLQYPESIHL